MAVLAAAGAAAAVMGAGPGQTVLAHADQGSFNPMAAYSAWNIVSFGDASITAESEGAVAAAGNVSFTGTNVATQHSATVDGKPVSLLTGGTIDLADSTGTLQVHNGGMRVGDASDLSLLDTDSNGASVAWRAVAKGAGYDSSPRAELTEQGSDYTAAEDPDGFSSQFSQDAAVTTSEKVADSASCAQQADVTIEGTTATVDLQTGTNYWSVSADQLSTLTQITFAGNPPSAANGTFLVVNVTGTPVTLNMTLAGSRDPSAILWNMPDATSLTQSGDSIDGSILAPKAQYTKSSANIQGTVVSQSASLGGSEEHYWPFKGQIGTCTTTPTSPSTTPTSPSTTPTSPSTTPTSPSTTPTSPSTTPTSPSTPGSPATTPSGGVVQTGGTAAGQSRTAGWLGLVGLGVAGLIGLSAYSLRRRRS
ncbi:choice-of-anchor A family protein [Propionibacterium freudenreichii]|uniref:choice-of-anchor A family protein n=1 Tax=Propionibacterium freudenreichii TaxID=1744 RepID=UPI00254A301F|nr:choice-of-anchor A family protein [Propionibacterium freudenreichii]MDK9620922.1 choice-of-anchor A family protein [Propionibacterium freudenreichii]MDK9623677.1 choice-of-anchor A family protein [Propionibacterium freudenreichii]